MSENELSRRGWILRIGGAALLHEIDLGAVSAAEKQPLPVGLYEPSLQHMAHALKVATASPAGPPIPQYFGAEDFALIRTLVARILGEEVSDPIVLEVAAWIDLVAGRAAETRAAARSDVWPWTTTGNKPCANWNRRSRRRCATLALQHSSKQALPA